MENKNIAGKSEKILRPVKLQSGEWTFIDQEGNIQEGRYKFALTYNEDFAAVMLQSDEWTFIDQEGNIQEGRYKDACNYCEGFARVQLKSGESGYIDKEGRFYSQELKRKDEESKKKTKDLIKNDVKKYKEISIEKFKDKKFICEIKNVIKEKWINETNNAYSEDELRTVFNNIKAEATIIKQKDEEVEKTLKEKENVYKYIEDFMDY